MRKVNACLRTGLMVRVAAVGLMASGVAACSSDTTRFGEDPFSNPFSSASNAPAPHRSEPRYTGSVHAAPTSHIQRAPLGAPSGLQSRPMRGYENSGGGYRSSMSEPASTGSIGGPRSMGGGSSNWSAQGGSTVTLGQGETVTTLANRYGVPASAILQANNLQNANGVGPGQQLIIPTYSATRVSSAAPAPMRQAPTAYAPSNPMGAAPMPAPMAQPKVAALPSVHTAPNTKMNFVPGAQPAGATAAKVAAPAQKVAMAAAPLAAAKPAPAPVAAKPAVAAKVDTSDNVKTASLKADPAPAAAPAASGSDGPSFRWPVRGRVISAYGSKSSGSSNDGINLAVPEGTEVKASDDGVVAYAGSELKGFGNLVLIRHSNGWVTAYAHNSALEVKRGDSVRRGQIIAKSGSTGNVSSPQLHFEVRKGATTVDPLQHLPNA